MVKVKSHMWAFSDGKGELRQAKESTYGEDASIVLGELCYSEEGELEDFCLQELVEGAEKIYENYRERFEDHFVNIPHPFQVGDHVRIIGMQDTGIILIF